MRTKSAFVTAAPVIIDDVPFDICKGGVLNRQMFSIVDTVVIDLFVK